MSQGRNVSLDIYKLLLSILVVAGHTSFMGGISDEANYLTRQGLCRIIVPSFFIINGYFFYYFLQKGSTASWFKRIFILYAFWMIIYSYFWLRNGPANADAQYYFEMIFFGFFQLWYLPGIIGAGFLMLFLSKLPSRQILLVCAGLYLLGLIVQYVGNYHLVEDPDTDELLNNPFLYRNFAIFALPFFAIGYLMSKHQLPQQLDKRWITGLAIAGVLGLMAESWWNYLHVPASEDFDFLVTILLACPFLVMWFMRTEILGNSKQIALYASGIYFVHPAFMILMRWHTDIRHMSAFILTMLLSVVATWFLIQVNKRFNYIL